MVTIESKEIRVVSTNPTRCNPYFGFLPSCLAKVGIYTHYSCFFTFYCYHYPYPFLIHNFLYVCISSSQLTDSE